LSELGFVELHAYNGNCRDPNMEQDQHLDPYWHLEKTYPIKADGISFFLFLLKFTLFMEVNYTTMYHLFLTFFSLP